MEEVPLGTYRRKRDPKVCKYNVSSEIITVSVEPTLHKYIETMSLFSQKKNFLICLFRMNHVNRVDILTNGLLNDRAQGLSSSFI